jgi:hypothetical protein
MARDKKQPATTPTPLTYPAWKEAAAKDLLERHGIKASVRGKKWRDWFIRGMTPAVAADRARADYDATRPLVDRAGRRKQ